METRKPYPTDLTDEQFALIEPELPKEKDTGRKRKIPLREIVNALLYKTKTACQWRMLPHDLPNHHTVYSYFTWWTIDGTWDRILARLREQARREEGREPTPSAAIIDSQSVKTTGYGGEPGTIGVDGNKRVNGRKRHLLVDTLGLILFVLVTAANVSDAQAAKQMVEACLSFPRLQKIWVDGVYKGDVVSHFSAHQITMEVVEKPEGQKGFVVSPKRWVVERTFGWLGWDRSLSRDFEYNPRHSESMIKLSQIGLLLRRLKPPSKPDKTRQNAFT
jgi:putative transposase